MNKLLFILGFFAVTILLLACGQKSIPAEKPSLPEAAAQQPQANVKEKWEEEWEKARSIAKREGRLIIFLEASSSAAREPIAKAMRNFGVQAEVLSLVSAELNRKLLIERRAGLHNADIIITGGGSMANTLKPAGVFGNLEENFILPEVREAKNWRDGKMPWFDKDRFLLSSSLLVRESANINTTLVRKEEMSSYRVLLDPRWKGKIVMGDPSIPGKAVAIMQTYLNLMGLDYIRQLARQEILISRDQRLLAEWVGRGKYSIGIALVEQFVTEMQKAGLPLDDIIFKEGTGLGTGASIIGIVDRPVHPGSSRLFINWFLSKEGQTQWSQAISLVSRRVDVPIGHLAPIKIPQPGVLYLNDPEEWYLQWPELMKLFGEIFG